MAQAKRKATARKIAQAVKQDGQRQIGSMVYWACEGIDVAETKLRKIFKEHNLDEDRWFPAVHDEVRVFRNAIVEVQRRDPSGKRRTRDEAVLVRPVSKGEKEIVMGVVDEKVNEAAAKLDHDHDCSVVLVKATDTAPAKVVVRGKKHPSAVAIQAKFEELQEKYITRDIYQALTRNIHQRMGSVVMRKNGGLYFVPAIFNEEIDKHQKVIEALGTSEFYAIPVFDNAKTQRDMGRQVRRSLEEELVRLVEELEKFKTEKAPRPDTAARRLEEFQALRKKVAMYSDLLSIKVDDLQTGIKDAALAMKALLGNLEKAKEEKKTERKADAKKERKAKKPAAKKAKTAPTQTARKIKKAKAA